jgi:hypothetical protein
LAEKFQFGFSSITTPLYETSCNLQVRNQSILNIDVDTLSDRIYHHKRSHQEEGIPMDQKSVGWRADEPWADLYHEAWLRVGRTDAERARWLLDLLDGPVPPPSTAEWESLRWEAAAFAYQFPAPTSRPVVPDGSLREIHGELKRFFDALRRSQSGTLALGSYTVGLSMNRGQLQAYRRTWKMAWADAFRLRVYEVLIADEVRDRIRFCRLEKCRRPFLAGKGQEYCGPQCSQAFRTRKYRTERRAEFQTWRRQAYARKVREKLGRKVKVGRRSEG